jgi:nitrogen fixation protein FixH
MRTIDDVPKRRALWIPAIFVGLMLLVVAVNGTLIYFATHTFSGLDTDHAYQEGLDYNKTIAAAAASAALGWHAEVTTTPTALGDRLTLRLTDKSGQPVDGLKVTAHLVRPVSTAFDQVVELEPASGGGQYQADVSLPARGKWEIRLVARGNGPEWQQTANVFLK